MATKVKQKTFNVTAKLTLEIGFEITAESLQQAAEFAQNMGVSDIVDFQMNGWDHNDSEKPVITGVFIL